MKIYTIINRKKTICRTHGFTLTEVLLAVMIVGLIGVALASLTRTASREAGTGRSRIMLRNNLSMFLRTLRKDLSQTMVIRDISNADDLANLTTTTPVVLIQVGKNVDSDGNKIIEAEDSAWVTYCFVRGSEHENVVPASAYRGGKIYRLESSSAAQDCNENTVKTGKVVLDNVKYIPANSAAGNSDAFPLIRQETFSENLVRIYLITELKSYPVVNDVIDERFFMPIGGN